MTKVCTKCGIEKDASQFYRRKDTKSGLRSICNICEKEYRERTKDRIKETRITWKIEHTEILKERKHKYYEENKEYCSEWHKQWYQKNKEAIKARRKLHYQQNKEATLEANRAYSEANKEKVREIARLWMANKRSSSVKRRLDERVSTAMYHSLRNQKNRRSWKNLVSYSIEELMAHLERKFKKGMSWDNMGEWHIDHVIPKSKFYYTTPDDMDFKRCWSLKNLQPLWATDNMKKGNRIHKPFQPGLKIAV